MTLVQSMVRELDRLRAENAELRRQLEKAKSGWRVVRTVYAAGNTPEYATKNVMSERWHLTPEDAGIDVFDDEAIYAVTLTARVVTP